MAYEIIKKYIRELPLEKQIGLLPYEDWKKIFGMISYEQQIDVIVDVLRQMPKEQCRKYLEQLRAEFMTD